MGAWIDLKTWKRRDHYQLFRRYRQPFFGVTVDVDVTAVWNGCHKPGATSFFLTSLFLMLKAVNDVEAFRLRLRPRGVWRHDRVGVGPTIRRPDETFGFARFEPTDSLDDFVELSNAAIARSMTGSVYTNAIPGTDSIPRIVFGCAVRDGRRMKMPVAVEVHHALVDGLDVGRFFERFSEELERGRVFGN